MVNKTKTFKRKDYNSGEGMVTSTWGPAAWHFIHTISFNYPVNPTKEDKKNYRNFIFALQHVLPCKYCRMNLKKNLKQLPLTLKCMKNRETFSKYLYNLHELVNKMLHKKSGLTYCQVRERYEHFRSRCTQNAKDSPKLFNDKDIKESITKSSLSNKKKHSGCTEPLWGKKSKCIIKIVPQTKKIKTFSVDKKCIKRNIKSTFKKIHR